MSKNNIPIGLPALFYLAKQCQDGAASVGPGIPLVLNTSSVIGSQRSNAVQLQLQYETGLATFTTLYNSLDSARAQAVVFIYSSRLWLMNFLGRRWSQAWRAAGWDNNSFAVPTTEAGVCTLLERLQLYYGSHVPQENAALQLTATRAGTLCTALTGARAGLNARRQMCDGQRDSRDEAVSALRRRLRSLCQELTLTIGNSDPRWRDFGLNIPSAPAAPAVPREVLVNNSTPGQLLISCPAVPLATHYRFFKQQPLVDPEPVFLGRADDPMFLATGLPAGLLDVYVSAANAGGESALSTAVRATVLAELAA